jgi:hypothetical protein
MEWCVHPHGLSLTLPECFLSYLHCRVMPAALVPRPWDFAPPLPEKGSPFKKSDGEPPEPPAKVDPALNGPTLAFPGSKNGLFTPNALELPPVMITPPTLPRGIGAPSNEKWKANPFPLN